MESLSEVDRLRLQVAAARAERDQALARLALQAFEHERERLAIAYGLTGADSMDVITGVLTRGKKDG